MSRERKWKSERRERGRNESTRNCKSERRQRGGEKERNAERGVRRKHGKTSTTGTRKEEVVK